MILFGLLLIPFVIGAITYFAFNATITAKEYVLMVVVSGLVGVGGYEIAKWGAMQDTEHWNGRITAKRDGGRSCCHCTTVCDSRDEDGTCTSSHEECQHNISGDWYWLLDVSTGDTLGNSCIHQSSAPSWYSKAYKGEPAAVERRYTNYLKADLDSLLTPASEKYIQSVPSFPSIHGVYKVDRVISRDVPVPPSFNAELDEMNARLGSTYQIDVLVLLTKNKDPDFARSVEAKWMYGPKNAVTIVMGVPDGKTIEWARVITLSRVERMKIEMRDGLPGMSLADPTIFGFIENEIKTQYKRTPMGEFEYLASDVEPTTGMTIFLYIFNLLVVIGMAYWMHKEDVFGRRKLRRW